MTRNDQQPGHLKTAPGAPEKPASTGSMNNMNKGKIAVIAIVAAGIAAAALLAGHTLGGDGDDRLDHGADGSWERRALGNDIASCSDGATALVAEHNHQR